jgi:hypothetical protein
MRSVVEVGLGEEEGGGVGGFGTDESMMVTGFGFQESTEVCCCQGSIGVEEGSIV